MQTDRRRWLSANLKSFKGSVLAAFAVLIFSPLLAQLAAWLSPDWSTGLLLGISGGAMLLATAWLAFKLGSSAYRTAADGGFADAPDTQLPAA